MQHKDKQLFKCKLIVDGFPSRAELFQLLEDFIQKNNFTKNYKADNKDSSVVFIFNNPDLVFGFTKQLNMEQVKNSLYKKLRTNIIIDAVVDEKKKEDLKTKDYSHEKDLYKSISRPRLTEADKSIDKSTIGSNKSISKRKKQYYNNENDYTAVLPRGKSIRSSEPVQDYRRMNFEEYMKQKEKWVDKRGFMAGQNTKDLQMKYVIPNYVHLTPGAFLPQRHELRKINKDAWVTKKNFSYRNAKDLVL